MPPTMLSLVLMLSAAPIVTSDAHEICPGTRVRIAWTKGAAEAPHRMREEGKVVANEGTAITVELDGIRRTKVRVPWASVRSLEVRTGRKPLGDRLAKGIAYGVAIGAVTGVVLAEATDHGCRPGEWCILSHGDVVRIGAGALGIVGGFSGGLAGLAGGQQWSPVSLGEDKVTVLPEIGPHRGGVRIVVRF